METPPPEVPAQAIPGGGVYCRYHSKKKIKTSSIVARMQGRLKNQI